MNSINNALREHSLHYSRSPEEFATYFERETGKSFNSYVHNVIDARIQNILLVGSLPSQTATSVSDVDVFVTADRSEFHGFRPDRAGSAVVLHNPAGGLMQAQIISVINGIEVDIYVLDAEVLSAVVEAISLGRLHLSQFDIKIVALLKNAWNVYRDGGHVLFLPDNTLDVYCSTRAYTLAVQEFTDACLAKESDVELTIHLCRSIVELLMGAYMAQQGVCFLGVKWIKKIRKLRKELERCEQMEDVGFIDQSLELLFGYGAMCTSKTERALCDVHHLFLSGRSLIERDPFFAAAYANCPQIPEVSKVSAVSQPIVSLNSQAVRELIERIWCKVLKVESIDSKLSYFDLGGTSLNAARMLGEICRQMCLTINFPAFYSHPYLDTLVNQVMIAQCNGHKPQEPIAKVDL